MPTNFVSFFRKDPDGHSETVCSYQTLLQPTFKNGDCIALEKVTEIRNFDAYQFAHNQKPTHIIIRTDAPLLLYNSRVLTESGFTVVGIAYGYQIKPLKNVM